MSPTEFIILLISAPFGVKALDYSIEGVKTFLKRRKEKLALESQHEIDLRKLDQIQAVDLSKTKREDFSVLMSAATEMAKNSMERARIAEEERDQEKELREKCENEFKDKLAVMEKRIADLSLEFGNAKTENRSCHLILEQVERNFRLILDTFHIAYWESDAQGKCTLVNDTFLELTGLDEDQCKGDGWFNAIDKVDLEEVSHSWRKFIKNQQKHTSFDISFVHSRTGEKVKVSVMCEAIMLNGFEIYKYTAQTTPIIKS
jgi:PAS domain S-box-containing protein